MNQPSTTTPEGNGELEQLENPVEEPPKEKLTADDPVFVSAEDRLTAVNLHLRAQSLMKDEQLIRSEFEKLASRRQLVQNQLNTLEFEIKENLTKLQARYGINLETHEIRESDGLVTLKKGVNQLDQLRRQMGT